MADICSINVKQERENRDWSNMDGNQEDANPFSFKKFVTATDSQKGKTLEFVDDDDIFKVPDRKQEASKKLLISDDVEVPKKTKKKAKSENPFSFKKFLSGGSSKKVAGAADNVRVTGEQNPVFEHADNNSLPDFVQDQSHLGVHKSHSSDSFELPLDLPHLPGNNAMKADCVKTENTNNDELSHQENGQLRRSESFSSFDDENDYMNTSKENFGNILPDFLSEVSKSETKTLKKSRLDVQDGSDTNMTENRDSDSDINELREENVRLKEQLEVLESKRREDNQRISELENQVIEQRKKEVEETSIMENAMEQVEENLRITTQRAVNAEGTISKLKQEMKTLQAELKANRCENGHGKSDHLSDVKERTSYVAEQLSTATKTAESSLRDLLLGVDKLKVLSQVLDSVDKIREHKEETETPGDSTS